MFVASVGAVQTDASIVVFEWLVVSPDWPARRRVWAVEHLMRAGLVYATAVGKRPVMLNVPRGGVACGGSAAHPGGCVLSDSDE